MADQTCNEHTGCVARIHALECNYKNLQAKVDSIMGKMNSILGGLVVSILLLLLNILIGLAGNPTGL
jgi:hypothetical protein